MQDQTLPEAPATEAAPTGLEFALAEILTAINGNDPVGEWDAYEDCSSEELHIHRELNRLRDLITVIRVKNDIPVAGAR